MAFCRTTGAILWLWMPFSALFAQVPPERGQTDFDREFERFGQQAENGFEGFSDSLDRAFADFMAAAWTDFELQDNPAPPPPPKPAEPPRAPDTPPPPQNIPGTPAPSPVPPTREPSFEPSVPEQSPPRPEDGKNFEIEFFGLPLSFVWEKPPRLSMDPPLDKNSVPNAWLRLAETEHGALVYDLARTGEQLHLSGWAFVLLARKIALHCYPDRPSDQLLLTAFLLNKTSCDAKLGYTRNQAFLLLSVQETVYDWTYLTDDGKKYYLADFGTGGADPDLTGFRSYAGTYTGNPRPLSLRISKPMLVKPAPVVKPFSFQWKGQTVAVNGAHDQNMTDFYGQIPHGSFDLYFSAPMAPSAYQSLAASLAPIIRGKSPLESVNILLRFVQTAFRYQTDQQQFGQERYLFPEEVLCYPFSDCEDRSALFIYLVRELLHYPVVGLIFPGHAAAAVKFPVEVSGDHVLVDGEKYVICDPTYINADAGQCMPQFRGGDVSIELVRLHD